MFRYPCLLFPDKYSEGRYGSGLRLKSASDNQKLSVVILWKLWENGIGALIKSLCGGGLILPSYNS